MKNLCAAIWYKELATQRQLPRNINKGVVICGYRHYHCIDLLNQLTGFRSVKTGANAVGDYEQGFLTDTNEFVDRKTALKIARENNQLLKEVKRNILFSEDLYDEFS